MPLVGLKDDKGKNWTWKQVAAGKGEFSDPLPILMSLYHDRKSYCDYSVTELKDDPYHLQMIRRFDYFESVDELADRMMGTAFHALMEKKNDLIDGHAHMIREKTMSIKLKGKVIGGTPDLTMLDKNDPTHGTMWDYKTVTTGKLAMISKGKGDALDDWKYQLNCYRLMLKQVHGVTVDKLYVRAIVRDWRFYEYRNKNCDMLAYPKGCIVPIPVMKYEAVEKYMAERLARHVIAERLSDEDLHTVGECDVWGGIRCEHYCPVSSICRFRLQDKRKPAQKASKTGLVVKKKIGRK